MRGKEALGRWVGRSAVQIVVASIWGTGVWAQAPFQLGISTGSIQCDAVTEASGLAASRKNPGVLWTHNDSGGKNAIYALDVHGRCLGVYRLAGAQNRDWEDIAVGPAQVPGEWYVYVGEIGDNRRQYQTKRIYRVREPTVDTLQAYVDTVLTDVQRVTFVYPDGIHNAETLMVDGLSGCLLVVSKESPSVLYRLPASVVFSDVPTTRVDTAEVVGRFLFSTAVGGDVSASGLEMLVKTYRRVYYWRRDSTQTLAEMLHQLPTTVPYVLEPQGEAVCWAADDGGYFTTSEGAHAAIHFYARAGAPPVKVGQSSTVVPSGPGLWVRLDSASGLLRVRLRMAKLDARAVVQVVNVRGQVVAEKAVAQPGAVLDFQTASLASGTYFVALRHGSSLVSRTRFQIVR